MVEATTIDLSCACAAVASTPRRRRMRSGIGGCASVSFSLYANRAARRPGTGGASGVVGRSKNVAAGPLSMTRPRCMSTMSPASRRASPRSCVAITTLIRRAAIARITSSIGLGGGGVEARGRLVEEQHLRIAGERASKRQPLLLAAGQPPRRTIAQPGKSDQREQFLDPRRPLRRGRRRRWRAHSRCWRRRCGEAWSGAGTRWRAASAAQTRGRPRSPHRRRARSGPSSRAAAWSCRRRSARSARSARPARSSATHGRGWPSRAQRG